MKRRTFLTTAAASAISFKGSVAAESARFQKGICTYIFPRSMPLAERFAKARDAGFEAFEVTIGGDIPINAAPADVREIAASARKAGVPIVTLSVSEPFGRAPLNSPDPAVREEGVQALLKAIAIAGWLDCNAILLVPGRVGSGPKLQAGYQDTWDRFTVELKKVIPAAEKAKVSLNMENVWNKFLLSPMDMKNFVDQFHSPHLQTHFDIGNVMQFGYPQDWILTLGPRIKRVHLKDYKLPRRGEPGRFVDLLEGDVDWKAVMSALVQVGYRGPLCAEIDRDEKDPEQLAKLSQTIDKIVAMA